jgi:hypothetical protein
MGGGGDWNQGGSARNVAAYHERVASNANASQIVQIDSPDRAVAVKRAFVSAVERCSLTNAHGFRSAGRGDSQCASAAKEVLGV